MNEFSNKASIIGSMLETNNKRIIYIKPKISPKRLEELIVSNWNLLSDRDFMRKLSCVLTKKPSNRANFIITYTISVININGI